MFINMLFPILTSISLSCCSSSMKNFTPLPKAEYEITKVSGLKAFDERIRTSREENTVTITIFNNKTDEIKSEYIYFCNSKEEADAMMWKSVLE